LSVLASALEKLLQFPEIFEQVSLVLELPVGQTDIRPMATVVNVIVPPVGL